MPGIVWIWLAAVVIFLILELMTPTLVFACFVAGSLVSGVVSFFYPENYYLQLGVFVAVSVILLPLTRSLARKITKPSPQMSNVDALIGKSGVVTKTIEPDLAGQVRLDGDVWLATANEKLDVDTRVTVISVSGAKVQVQKNNDERIEP